MTPKKKAFELLRKFSSSIGFAGSIKENINLSKQCALTAVDMVLEALKSCWDEQGAFNMYNYWQEVKQEIEKL